MNSTPARADQRRAPIHPNHALAAYLENHREQLLAALPRHLTPERMMRLAATAVNSSPKLRQCDAESVIAAVVTASQLGLEIGVGGQAFLVPYRDRDGKYHAQLVPGWQGYIDLVARAGRASAWTGAVYAGDEFDFELGSAPYLRHKPIGDRTDPDHLVGVYACGKVNGADHPIIEYWPIAQVWAHRDRGNRQGDDHYSFRFPEMYARKVVLLQVLKYLPKSVELVEALDLAKGDGGLAIRGEYQVLDGEAANDDGDGNGLALMLDAIAEADTPEQLDLLRSQIDELPSGQQRHAYDALTARARAMPVEA